MKNFTQATTILGQIIQVQPNRLQFELKLRNGDQLTAYVGPETFYTVLENLDRVSQDVIPKPDGFDDSVEKKMEKYLREGDYVFAQGVLFEHDADRRFDARAVRLLHSKKNAFLFEETHWWLSQITRMADEWLDDLFGDNRDYQEEDFSSLYRTNLNVYGGKTDDNIQTAATLSRLIYGLSSAYLLTGCKRYLDAARAGVQFQRSAFRNLTHDGRYCFWSHGRRKGVNGPTAIISSLNPDDFGAIPLYEQIYAIAGLAQYYRITNDPHVLQDIRRTVMMFEEFYLDDKRKNPDFPGHDGYFSHIHPSTMRPDTPSLESLMLRKNWNSIGDHIPAYLINLILALDPLPKGADQETIEFLDTCERILSRCTDLIIKYFPDPDPQIPYVRERFFADWKPDLQWSWQKNRAIVGHNLKIAWNLTRIANYYLIKGDRKRVDAAIELAKKLADSMITKGLDLVRGGCFDAVERIPAGNQPIEFVWGNTKDFWQQEQGILAYLILYGHTRRPEYLNFARDMCAFWNQFFLDRDNIGIWFRVTESGNPVVEGSYLNKAGYPLAGYHSFELNYLAHVYMRTYVSGSSGTDNTFCLYFRPESTTGLKSLNVLPDFLKPGEVRISGLWINGYQRDYSASKNFQILLGDDDYGKEIIVQFTAKQGEEK
jgi:mannose/cellobiose epimerase-like protein (N-acyl-D-glucosamine 2-epimerase family)